MPQQKTKDRSIDGQIEHPGGDPFEGGAGNLAQQAAAYANVARQARRDCEQGAEAERALEARRNRSGQ